MPDLIGELNPDPHFPLEVNQGSGIWTCAVPNCKKHKYPRKSSAPIQTLTQANFLGGKHPGLAEFVGPAKPSVNVGKEEYVLGNYEKGDGASRANPYAAPPRPVYYPAEEMP